MTGSTRLPAPAPEGPGGGVSAVQPRASGASHGLVRRLDAERYMRVMLLGFAGSVLGTRAYLAATGYPQIGGDTLHIAHALWGGLGLFAAALLALLMVNRAALVWVALLTGVGAGLFVDEVGKFITVDNDYFFPAAAPIAYAVFLLAVWVYVRARRRRDPGPRAELHAALELLGDAVDHDLDPRGHAELVARLHSASHARTPELAGMTSTLLELARPGALPVTPDRPGRLRRAARRLDALTDRWLTPARLRLGLIAVLAVLGVSALSDLTVITTVAADLADGSTSELVEVANTFARVDIEDRRGVLLLLTRAVLDICVGLALLAAAVLLARARTAPALELAQTGLLLSLTAVNLLVFYLEQFLAALGALVQLGALYAVQRYQKHRS